MMPLRRVLADVGAEARALRAAGEERRSAIAARVVERIRAAVGPFLTREPVEGWLAAGVYIVRRADTREIKIGVTEHVARRLAALQTAHGEPLALVAVLPGGVPEEQALHAQFAAYRKRGEWFHETGEMAEWLRTL